MSIIQTALLQYFFNSSDGFSQLVINHRIQQTAQVLCQRNSFAWSRSWNLWRELFWLYLQNFWCRFFGLEVELVRPRSKAEVRAETSEIHRHKALEHGHLRTQLLVTSVGFAALLTAVSHNATTTAVS